MEEKRCRLNWRNNRNLLHAPEKLVIRKTIKQALLHSQWKQRGAGKDQDLWGGGRFFFAKIRARKLEYITDYSYHNSPGNYRQTHLNLINIH